MKLLQDNGMRADMSSVHNRLSMVAQKRAQQSDDEDNRQQHLAQALQEAKIAFDLAVELDREIDTAFAGEQYIKMCFEQADVDHKAIADAGEILASPELWAEVPLSFLRARVLKWAQGLTQTQESPHKWAEKLISILSSS